MNMAPLKLIRLTGCVAIFPIGLLISRHVATAESHTQEPQNEIRELEARIDRTESEALQQWIRRSRTQYSDIELIGKLLLFDRELSVNRNEACAFCHMPETGFTGPISSLNATTVAYPGSVRTRFSSRRPQSHTYATFAPALHYNAPQGDFVGGAFWDMRATGGRLNSPVAEQAEGPPLNPVEMGIIDSACVVYRMSARPYRKFAEGLWGAQAFAIQWPSDIEQICNRPGPADPRDPFPVRLSAVDRGTANRTFDQFGEAVAAYEASGEVNPFSSKYDAVMAGKAEFTPEEKAGYALFRSSRTHCNECHRDGGPGEEPLFTDFTASNLGLPANLAMPFYSETNPDSLGFAANPDGPKYLDKGVGGFLSSPANPRSDWAQLAPAYTGKFKVPTLRNIDQRPSSDFVKAYMHNGYLKSLKEVMHFYNTRDSLPRCAPNDPGEKTICWPAPEYPSTMNKRQLGNLQLSDQEENQIIAFLKTLTDGYIRKEQ